MSRTSFELIGILLFVPGLMAAAEQQVTIEVKPQAGATVAAVRLQLDRVDGDHDTRNVTIENGRRTIALPVGSHWTISSASPGSWAAPDFLAANASDKPFQVRIWPTATIHGTVNGTPQPPSITVTADALPSRSMPRVVVTAAVANGLWHCEIPVGRFDLALRFPASVPIYHFAVQVSAGAKIDLGPATPIRGSSVAGYVSHEGERVPVHVQLAYPTAEGADALARTRLTRPVAEADANVRGFFQLKGVPPGTYRLVVASDRFATKAVYPVKVYRDAETMIAEPVVLQPPLSFSIAITPPQTSAGRPWRVNVRAVDATGSVPFDARTDPRGLVTVERQAPGRFEAMVFDEQDNPANISRIEVTHDHEIVPITMEFVHLSGTITRGKEPVSGTLFFGGRQGAPRVSVRSEGGTFIADLPRAGRWVVDVVSDDFSSSVETEVVADTEGKADITLRIPLNVVTGKIVDETGKPVALARVVLSGAATLMADSDADGTFSFNGVPAGDMQVVAFADRGPVKRQTGAAQLTIHDDVPSEPLFLQLLPASHVVGQIQSPYGVVAGAVVTITSSAADAPIYETATTGVDGGFEVNIPAPLRTATAIVAAPGFAFRAFTIPLDGRTVVLSVPVNGGTLRIHRPETGDPLLLLVTQDGMTIPPIDLMRWAQSQPQFANTGGAMTIANMSAGVYKACVARQDAPVLNEKTCREGTLAPGGELDLSPGL